LCSCLDKTRDDKVMHERWPLESDKISKAEPDPRLEICLAPKCRHLASFRHLTCGVSAHRIETIDKLRVNCQYLFLMHILNMLLLRKQVVDEILGCYERSKYLGEPSVCGQHPLY
jgi:hypothetical protein